MNVLEPKQARRARCARFRVCCCALTLVLLGADANCEERLGVRVGVGLGQASSEARDEAFEASGISYRVLAGYHPIKYVGAEAEYFDAEPVKDTIGPYELELGVSGITVSAVGAWPLGRWTPFVKLGYSFYESDQSIRLGTLRARKTLRDEDPAGGLGLQFRLTERVGVRAEYAIVVPEDGRFETFSLNALFEF